MLRFDENTTETTSDVEDRLKLKFRTIAQKLAVSVPTEREESAVNVQFTLKFGQSLSKKRVVQRDEHESLAAEITEEDIHTFCQAVQKIAFTYEARFYHEDENNIYASKEFVTEVKDLFLPFCGKTALTLFQQKPQLKEQLQGALMGLLKQLCELDVQRLVHKYPDCTLDTHRLVVFGENFDNLHKFQQYIQRQCYGAKKHLITFRFLFPLAEPKGEVPTELQQSAIKPFIELVEKAYQLAFSESRLARRAIPIKKMPMA